MMTGTAWSQDATTQAFELPRVKRFPEGLFYPEVARHYGQQGRVVAEFKINRRGRVTDDVIVESGPTPLFDASARRLVRGLFFDVPADWEQSAAADHRYRVSIKFHLYHCVPATPCDAKRTESVPDDPDVDSTIKVTTSG